MNFEKFHSQLELPYLETKKQFLPEIFKILEIKFGLKSKSRQKFIDLGAGNGSIVIYVALNYEINSFGFEINESLINEAKGTLNLLRKEKKYTKTQLKKVKFENCDFYLQKLNQYDFIYIYSLPSMHKYLKHLFKTAKKGTVIISHKYPLKILNDFLVEEYELIHKNTNQELYTYFYKKIK